MALPLLNPIDEENDLTSLADDISMKSSVSPTSRFDEDIDSMKHS